MPSAVRCRSCGERLEFDEQDSNVCIDCDFNGGNPSIDCDFNGGNPSTVPASQLTYRSVSGTTPAISWGTATGIAADVTSSTLQSRQRTQSAIRNSMAIYAREALPTDPLFDGRPLKCVLGHNAIGRYYQITENTVTGMARGRAIMVKCSRENIPLGAHVVRLENEYEIIYETLRDYGSLLTDEDSLSSTNFGRIVPTSRDLLESQRRYTVYTYRYDVDVVFDIRNARALVTNYRQENTGDEEDWDEDDDM